jgi:hypothetical protein
MVPAFNRWDAVGWERVTSVSVSVNDGMKKTRGAACRVIASPKYCGLSAIPLPHEAAQSHHRASNPADEEPDSFVSGSSRYDPGNARSRGMIGVIRHAKQNDADNQ